MASDISLAVGDGSRRMTYAELAAARRISSASARRLVLRHRWPRQKGNDGYVRVTVPLAWLTADAPEAEETAPEARSRSDYLLQLAWTPTQLYRHYDAQAVLLYVGLSHSSRNRLDEHKKSPWHHQIARVLVENFPTRIEAQQAEETAISEEHPVHNDLHNAVRQRKPLNVPTLRPIGDSTILHRRHGDIEIVPVRRHIPTSEETAEGVPSDVTATGRAFETALSICSAQLEQAAADKAELRQQLDRERARADRAEQETRDLRRQLDVSQAAERRAHDEAERRRAELEAAWEWGLLRRLRWALSHKR